MWVCVTEPRFFSTLISHKVIKWSKSRDNKKTIWYLFYILNRFLEEFTKQCFFFAFSCSLWFTICETPKMKNKQSLAFYIHFHHFHEYWIRTNQNTLNQLEFINEQMSPFTLLMNLEKEQKKTLFSIGKSHQKHFFIVVVVNFL